MRTARWGMIAALATGAGLFAFACGGDDSSSSNPADGGSDASSDVTQTDGGTDAVAPGCTADPCVTAVSAGAADTCALITGGTVRCWGSNSLGTLGSGTALTDGGFDPSTVLHPTPVDGLSGVAAVSAGSSFSCALLQNQTVSCWGDDRFGQLGRGATGSGDKNPAPISLSSPVTQISAGGSQGCALLQGGQITCWGRDAFGEAGQFPETNSVATPTPVTFPSSLTFKQVAASSSFTCALTTDGNVWCWGADVEGVLGYISDSGANQYHAPIQAPDVSGLSEIAVANGAVCGLNSAGAVVCWGYNAYCGRGAVSMPPDATLTPGPIAGAVTFKHVAGSGQGFCALSTDGNVWCWGSNFYGTMGTGAFDGGSVFSPDTLYAPAQVAGLANIQQISSGADPLHFCALLDTGAMKCWGANDADQLGAVTPPLVGLNISTASAQPLDVVF